MTIGAELDKQIFKEGESTWGCKCGVLDVEDVRNFLQDIKNWCNKNNTIPLKDSKLKLAVTDGGYVNVTKLFDFINYKAGGGLV